MNPARFRYDRRLPSPDASDPTMQFPYGLSDFATLMEGGYFYQDRTDRIPQLEAAGRQLIFIRPRRFGKSLLLSLLEHYYDLNRADQFDALFGRLAIGQVPTPLHNQYFVMKWDFSLVQAQGDLTAIAAALHRHRNDCVQDFALRYRGRLSHRIELYPNNALSSWRSALMAVSQTPHKLYLLIDAYDNFANEVLMAGRQRDDYAALLYGEGLLKTVFKAVKAAAGGQGLDRVFITGVSPIVLSDMTSGYNVGEVSICRRRSTTCAVSPRPKSRRYWNNWPARVAPGQWRRHWPSCAPSITAMASAKTPGSVSITRP